MSMLPYCLCSPNIPVYFKNAKQNRMAWYTNKTEIALCGSHKLPWNVLTRNSRVRPMSRIDLTPAETTAMGVLPSSVRSALMSRPKKDQSKHLEYQFIQCTYIGQGYNTHSYRFPKSTLNMLFWTMGVHSYSFHWFFSVVFAYAVFPH